MLLGFRSLARPSLRALARRPSLRALATAMPKHTVVKVPADVDEDAESARVVVWKKQVGQEVRVGDELCELELESFTIGLEAQEDGFVAALLCEATGEAEDGDDARDAPPALELKAPLCVLVPAEEDVALYAAAVAEAEAEAESAAAASSAADAEPPAVEAKAEPEQASAPRDIGARLLRTLNRLSKEGKLGDVTLTKQLLKRARQEDAGLIRAFEASFASDNDFAECESSDDGFDVDFFLQTAREIVADDSDA